MNSFSVAEIAQKISATVVGDEKKTIHHVAPLYRATENELSYLASSAYEKHLKETKAAAVILSKDHAVNCTVTALIVSNPELAYAQAATLFDQQKKPSAGIHPSAVIAKTARIHPTASIGAHCVIGENVEIGERTVLLPSVIVNDDTLIGSDCFFHSHVTIYHRVVIHNHVILHSGVVIGADGFGFARDREKSVKIPQLGSVIIFDHVEIGANSCVDRGALDDTVIETGVKIDNFVQIAHNVRVGAHTVIAGSTSVAGSTTIGSVCVIGGMTAISTHLTICDGVILAGGSAVTGSIKKPGIYASGTGLMPHTEWRKNVVRFRQLDEWIRRIDNFMKNKQ